MLRKLSRDERGNITEPPEVKRAVLEAYEQASLAASAPKNVSYWLSKFMASDKFQRLSRLTQTDYVRYIEVVVDPKNPKSKATHNGIRFVFGNMRPEAVKPTHVRRYMDYWASAQSVRQDNGETLASEGKPVTANRHLSCLQSFFKWLRQYVPGIENNPADGIHKFPEESRKVYITDAQYLTLLQAALDSTTPWMFAFLEVAYLCGLRLSEACALNLDDLITDNGHRYLRITRKKGSKGELTQITERLQNSIDFAASLYPQGRVEPISNRPLIRNTRGDRVTRSAVNNAIQNLREITGIKDVVIHDMKKKAGTDGKDLGHRTKRMAELYNLKLKKTEATR